MRAKHVQRRKSRWQTVTLVTLPLAVLAIAGPEVHLLSSATAAQRTTLALRTSSQPLAVPSTMARSGSNTRLWTTIRRTMKPAARTVPSASATQAPSRVQRSARSAVHTKAVHTKTDTRHGAALATGVDLMAPLGGPFTTASVWKQDLRQAPVAADSGAMVDQLARQVEDHWGGIAALNVWNYNASFYTVPANQPRVDLAFSDCQHKGYTPTGMYGRRGQFVGVPIPADAAPAPGTDATLTIYQPGTDTMWEFWRVEKRPQGWAACWGGRIDHVSTSGGWFKNGFGASASGLASSGGMVGIRDARSGTINHALALAILSPAIWTNFSWPAQRSDGGDTSPHAIPEGTRLRLDPSLDVDALRIHPLAKMIAKAAQKYGFIVTDMSGAVAVVTENPAAVKAATGVDPWEKILAGTPNYLVMRGFPWRSLQALPKNYGKP